MFPYGLQRQVRRNGSKALQEWASFAVIAKLGPTVVKAMLLRVDDIRASYSCLLADSAGAVRVYMARGASASAFDCMSENAYCRYSKLAHRC